MVGKTGLALEVEFRLKKAVVGCAAAGFALGIAVHLFPARLVINAPAGRLAFVAMTTECIKGRVQSQKVQSGDLPSPRATTIRMEAKLEEKRKKN